ncbi:Na+/H+ antiporter subunit E [Verrucomicrobiales bacterium]|jgi:multicomponent Na+:H+ antiporter subunit E|nr:Na+/H+ antiporter subunit E [Verrucomicrobiales bacterium]|tara:strand:+ start:248 stop:787 length:540 start_codon:yes stop_codon:yes gene_type:complete
MEKETTNLTLYRAIVFGLLMVIWVIFSGLLDGFHLTLGVISCGLVTWMSSDLLFDDREIGVRDRLRQAARISVYLFWLLWQIVLANLHLLKVAFGSADLRQPQIVRYKTELKTDFEKFLLANSITLTPGTVTIKILGDTFYIHAINDFAAKGLDGEMDRRIGHIFEGSKSNVDAAGSEA